MKRGGALPGITAATPKSTSSAHAVLDVELQPSERLHQRFDVEGFFGPRAQIAKQAGAQAATAPATGTARRGRPARRFSSVAASAGAARAEGEVVHVAVRLSAGQRVRRQGLAAPPGNSRSDTARSGPSSGWRRPSGGRGRQSGRFPPLVSMNTSDSSMPVSTFTDAMWAM